MFITHVGLNYFKMTITTIADRKYVDRKYKITKKAEKSCLPCGTTLKCIPHHTVQLSLTSCGIPISLLSTIKPK